MPQLQSQETTDFSLGMDDSSAATAFNARAARLIVNGRIQPDGTVSRRPGSQRIHTTALTTGICFGEIWFRTAAGLDQHCVFIGGDFYVADGPTFSTFALEGSSLHQDYYDFAMMRIGATNYLFAANGDTTVKRWDGTTFDTLPTAPAGVKFCRVNDGRLWLAGHDGMHAVASRIADPTIFVTPQGLDVQIIAHGRSSQITGLGECGGDLLVYDLENVSRINGYGEQDLVVAAGAEGLSGSVGCIAFRTIQATGDEALSWQSMRGIEYYSKATGIRLISQRLTKFFDSLDKTSIIAAPGQPCSCYDGTRKEYHVALPQAGGRNDRTVVLRLSGDFLRYGAPPVMDEQQVTSATGILFAGGPEFYLETSASGARLRRGNLGYAKLAGAGETGDVTVADASDYLDTVDNDALPTSMAIAPFDGVGPVVHSVGHDGFVRRHWGVDRDDMLLDGTGGTPVNLGMVGRPHLFGSPRQRKRARVIHVSTLNESPATINLAVRNGGRVSNTVTVVMPATNLDQPKRKRVMVSAVGDTPQVELTTADDVRVTLLGISAELMREPV